MNALLWIVMLNVGDFFPPHSFLLRSPFGVHFFPVISDESDSTKKERNESTSEILHSKYNVYGQINFTSSRSILSVFNLNTEFAFHFSLFICLFVDDFFVFVSFFHFACFSFALRVCARCPD